MDYYDEFTEVYSISDLHLSVRGFGGEPVAASLANAVRALLARARALPGNNPPEPDKRAALVVNGDSVDFLDVPPQQHFDPEGAPQKLRDVIQHNQPFFVALDEFSRVGVVVLTLGNHDVELALPQCQAILRRTIRGALVLAFDGAGYRCRVGRATAYFLHGNNQDEWNHIDFDLLGRIAAALNTGNPPERWDPNEGTKLVIELLNQLKGAHPFVEYVKPEKPWLFELIDKLGIETLGAQYGRLAPRQVAATARYATFNRTAQSTYLGEGSASSGQATLFDANELLWSAEESHRRGLDVLAGDEQASETLGWVRRQRKPPDEIRAHILSSLVGDTTFEVAQSDSVYEALRSKLQREIKIVVCGHTHLRRSYRDRSDRIYLNSGTWMPLLDLYDASAENGQFQYVLQGLHATTRDELAKISWYRGTEQRPLLLRRNTVVLLQASAAGADAWLADFEAGALLEVPRSRQQVTL